jgi:hypothetical protein
MGRSGAKLPYSPRLVRCHVLRCEGLSPTTVHPSVDEDLGARVPEGASEGDALDGVPLHPVEGAVLKDLSPLHFVDGDVQERRDAARLINNTIGFFTHPGHEVRSGAGVFVRNGLAFEESRMLNLAKLGMLLVWRPPAS